MPGQRESGLVEHQLLRVSARIDIHRRARPRRADSGTYRHGLGAASQQVAGADLEILRRDRAVPALHITRSSGSEVDRKVKRILLGRLQPGVLKVAVGRRTVAHRIVKPCNAQRAEIAAGRLVLHVDRVALGEAVVGCNRDVVDLLVIEAVGLVQRQTTPLVVAGGRIANGNVSAVGQLYARASGAASRIAHRRTVSCHMVYHRANHAVEVQLGPARAANRHVADRKIAQACRSATRRRNLDAVGGRDVGAGAVQREVLQRHIVACDLHAVIGDTLGVNDRCALPCTAQGQAFVDLQRVLLDISACGDIDRSA